MPRLVPARFLAALRPDESLPFELPSAVTREARRRVRVAALLGTLAYGTFLALLLSPLIEGSRLQRSINLSLGTALSSISLTIPAVLTIGFITDRTIILGLDAVDAALLLLTLLVSMLTFALERTNVLLGAVHLLLFFAYLMLIFEK